MKITIRLRVKKEVDNATQKKILKLKGSIIAQSYTDIIHIEDQDEEYHINYFTLEAIKKEEVKTFIASYIREMDLASAIAFSE